MLVKFADTFMVLSILSIIIAMVFGFACHVFDLLRSATDIYFLKSFLCSQIISTMSILNMTFILCAFVFDLYKWWLFIIATGSKDDKEDKAQL